MSKDSMSQRKAAAYLGISPATLRSYVRANLGPRHVALRGIKLFETVDLDEWRSARTVEGAK